MRFRCRSSNSWPGLRPTPNYVQVQQTRQRIVLIQRGQNLDRRKVEERHVHHRGDPASDGILDELDQRAVLASFELTQKLSHG